MAATQITVVLIVLSLYPAIYSQGLFPRVSTDSNFALNQPITATSTCGDSGGSQNFCQGPACQLGSCNSTCPHSPPVEDPAAILANSTLSSGVTSAVDPSGTLVYTFDGTSGSFATVGDLGTLTSDPGFSITLWVNQTQGNEGYLLAKSTSDALIRYIAIYANNNQSTLLFEYHPVGLTSGFRTVSVSNVDLNGDHHLGVVMYGAFLSVFIDGELVRRVELEGVIEDGSGVIFVGRRQGGTSRFEGTIHSLLFYNKALVDEQIRAISGFGDPPSLFPECSCPVTHPTISTTNQSLCTSHDGTTSVLRINAEGHAVQLAVDGSSHTWWQSENGVSEVNVTVDFGHSLQIYYVSLHFRSLTPYGMVIHYSKDGITFTPKQYFAYNCSFFGFNSNTILSSETDVNCLSSHNTPEYNGYIEFRLLDATRPGAAQYNENEELRLFSLSRMVRIQMFGWHTYENRQSDLLTQYFAINEIHISGQECFCNGHASRCNNRVCECEHNTMGDNCELCLPLYNNRPWARGTISAANECEMCQCYGHASSCVYDSNLGMGRCINCSDNTRGPQCEECIPYYYNPTGIPLDSPEACIPCDCDQRGISDDGLCQQDGSGQCFCKTFVTGRQCDLCWDKYFNLSTSNQNGCQSCDCNVTGTVGGSTTCSQGDGQCDCLPNVGGLRCEVCRVGFFDFGNPAGCQPCDAECSADGGCTAAGPQNCVNCRNYLDLDGVTCVSQCTVDAFPDAQNRCTDCQNGCLQFTQTRYEAVVAENADLAVFVTSVSVTDRRVIDRPVEFSIISGENRQHFIINSTTGDIFVNAELNRETIASYNITIMAVDVGTFPSSSQSATAVVHITVTDINDSPPVFTQEIYERSVSEISFPNTLVVTVTATDDDIGTNALITYSITAGNEERNFVFNASTGVLSVSSSTNLDFESRQSYTLEVTAQDSGEPSLSGNATISITITPTSGNTFSLYFSSKLSSFVYFCMYMFFSLNFLLYCV